MKAQILSIVGLHRRKKVFIYCGCALVGVLTGFTVVAYRAVISFLEKSRASSLAKINGSPVGLLCWLAVAVLAGLLTVFLTKRSPLIKGSGIPQVKALLAKKVSFDWKRELPFKFIGGSLALGTGLSLGREGPSIQLGALVGNAIDTVAGYRDCGRYLVTAGAAAGISAAFNAPLAGVLFCVEELHRNFSPLMLTSTLISSFCANAIMWLFFGGSAVFDIPVLRILPFNLYFSAVLLIGIVSGLLGCLFNRGVLGFQRHFGRLVPGERGRMVLAFVAAAIVSLLAAPITGGGGELVQSLARPGVPLGIIGLLLIGKMLFTLFSYASGAPGGIFMPMLAIGALVGAAAQALLPELGVGGDFLANYILLGMAAFFVAVVRAPITGAVLITEMAGSLGHFPAFILVSVIAASVAGLLGVRPIYDSLFDQIANRSTNAAPPSP